jgi:hypothetical protein
MNTKLIVGATAGYLAAVNVGAAALFYYDKQQALHNGWRVSRSALTSGSAHLEACLTSLCLHLFICVLCRLKRVLSNFQLCLEAGQEAFGLWKNSDTRQRSSRSGICTY